jgi:aspartyl protease family protein
MGEFDGPWGGPPPPPMRRRTRLGLWLWLGLIGAAIVLILILTRLFPEQRSRSDWGEMIRLTGLLALVSSGLVATRRLDVGRTARNLAVWVAIFALIVVGYASRGPLMAAFRSARSALLPAYAVSDSPRSITIGRSEGDAFYVVGQINGAPVKFLIDTGATDIVLSPVDAAKAGLTAPAGAYSRPSETANGVGYSAPATVKSLSVGPIQLADVPVMINQAPMAASLLGMPFLKRLDSFEVKGDQLILRGRG